VKPTEVCQDFENWVDGNLDTQRQSRFEQHLPKCKSCQESLDRWRQLELDVVAAELLFSSTGSGQANELRLPSGGDSQSTKRQRRFRVFVLLGTIATLVLLTLGFWRFQGAGSSVSRSPVHGVPTFSSSGCPPGDFCIGFDPTLDRYQSYYAHEIIPGYENFSRIGVCALTGQVCVAQGDF